MAALDIAELSKKLSCPICLETLLNPKTLSCGHVYCKHCLDGLVTFSANPSAFFKCPQGCTPVTKLTSKQTSDDLITNYILKDVIEMTYSQKKSSAEGNDSDPTCQTCGGEPNVYQSSQKIFLCYPCYQLPGSHVTHIKYWAQRKELRIMCVNHSTCTATHVCCSEFICVYCANRGHKRHRPQQLAEVETSLKERIRNKMNSRECWQHTLASELEREDVEKEVGKVLIANKLRCLISYLQVLDEREVTLKKRLNLIVSKHIKEADPLGNLRESLEKDGTHFLLQRENITRLLDNIGNGFHVPSSTLRLSLTDPQHDSVDHPLGMLTSVPHMSAGTFSGGTTNAKLFDNSITTDINPGLSLKLLRNQLEEECSRYSDCPRINSVAHAINVDGYFQVYLNITVGRFSKRGQLWDQSEEVKAGPFSWGMQLKGLFGHEEEKISMYIRCRPAPIKPSFETTSGCSKR